jgi:hypothetical protein
MIDEEIELTDDQNHCARCENLREAVCIYYGIVSIRQWPADWRMLLHRMASRRSVIIGQRLAYRLASRRWVLGYEISAFMNLSHSENHIMTDYHSFWFVAQREARQQ